MDFQPVYRATSSKVAPARKASDVAYFRMSCTWAVDLGLACRISVSIIFDRPLMDRGVEEEG